MRHWIQICYLALSNGYWLGFFKGNIYQGEGKQLCLPGLHCYSCPGALGACPVGAVQAMLTGGNKSIPYYALGFLLSFGLLFGRGVCAMLCPFGFVQDMLRKLRPKSWKPFALPKVFRLLPLLVMLIFVIALPLLATNDFGISSPAFCKWICPSGTLLGGIPLLSLNEGLRGLVGGLFQWKLLVLVVVLLWSVVEYRPFCKYLCPLGVFYGWFQKISLYQMSFRPEKCVHCQACKKVCEMGVDACQSPNDAQCVRCGDCVKACPTQALSLGLVLSPKAQEEISQNQ